MNEDRKEGVQPSESLADPRSARRHGTRMRTPADMVLLTPELRRKLIANRARFLWQQKGLRPDLEAECWLEAENEIERKV